MQSLRTNPTSCLLVAVQFTPHLFQGHSIFSDHQFTNFCSRLWNISYALMSSLNLLKFSIQGRALYAHLIQITWMRENFSPLTPGRHNMNQQKPATICVPNNTFMIASVLELYGLMSYFTTGVSWKYLLPEDRKGGVICHSLPGLLYPTDPNLREYHPQP